MPTSTQLREFESAPRLTPEVDRMNFAAVLEDMRKTITRYAGANDNEPYQVKLHTDGVYHVFSRRGGWSFSIAPTVYTDGEGWIAY